MINQINLPREEGTTKTVEIAGPYLSVNDIHYLVVNGCRVPYIELWQHDNGVWGLNVDGRFGSDFTKDEIEKFGYILANAMAISAGYTHHGPNSQLMNRHSCGE
jgi:hypothetical protein